MQAGRTPVESRKRKGMSMSEEVSRRDSDRVTRKKRLVLARGSKQVIFQQSHMKEIGLSMLEEASRRGSGRVTPKKRLVLTRGSKQAGLR